MEDAYSHRRERKRRWMHRAWEAVDGYIGWSFGGELQQWKGKRMEFVDGCREWKRKKIGL